MKTIKTELKAQANAIKEMKQDISTGMREGQYRGNSQCALIGLKRTYRFNHIAYCMIRGKEYLEIENKTRPENKLTDRDMAEITSIMEEMKAQLLERTPKEELQDA